MSQILSFEGNFVVIGVPGGPEGRLPVSSIGYQNPKVGDTIEVNHDGPSPVIKLVRPTRNSAGYEYASDEKRINKHIFVWIGAFLFGEIGVDRFMRGQIGLGIFKLLTVGGFGIWALVDFIIAVIAAYGGSFGQDEDFVFVNGKYAK